MKKEESIKINFDKPIFLFREDLQTIEHVLVKDLKGRDFEISFDEYKSTDIATIPEDQTKTGSIYFKIYNPYVAISVGRFGTNIHCSDDTLMIRGAIEKVKDILKNRTSVYIVGLRKSLKNIALVFAGLTSYILFASVIDLKDPRFGQTLLLLFLCIICNFQMSFPPRSVISFGFKKDKVTFWRKNKDEIMVGFIVAMISAFIYSFF